MPVVVVALKGTKEGGFCVEEKTNTMRKQSQDSGCNIHPLPLAAAECSSNVEMMVCEQCGDAGFENAYVYCVNCLNFVIHRYCLPSLPAAFDEFVNWLCVDCESELGSRAGAKGAGNAPA